MRGSWLLLFCVGAACGSHHDNTSPADMAQPPPMSGPLMRLIEADFSLSAGTETLLCRWLTVSEDTYITRLVPVSPTGIHHLMLSIENAPQTDGIHDCSAVSSTWQTLFVSGVNSPELDLPDRVVFKIPAGGQIVLYVHGVNATTGTVSGTAGIDVATAVDPTQVDVAGATWIGKIGFTIPSSMLVDGSCTVSNDTRLFAMYPHMHETGAHMTVSVSGSINSVLWDQDFDFTNQPFGSWPPIQLAKGDQLQVDCRYSPAGIGRSFGQLVTDEMCFAVSYFTPPIVGQIGQSVCVQ